ncbi:hypothetical protein M8C21_030139, partial [Ambrosia artemisiifolia]
SLTGFAKIWSIPGVKIVSSLKGHANEQPIEGHGVTSMLKGVLFLPPKAPTDLYESYYNNNKSNLKLYVRRLVVCVIRVFLILTHCHLMYLEKCFNNLKTIKNKLFMKALDMIHKVVEARFMTKKR